MTPLILLVDDDNNMLTVLKRHFVNRGYEVVISSSGESALEMLKTEDVSLVITDLRMVGINGLELCDRVSGNYVDLPVLILTAFGTLDTAIEAIRAGAYDFVVKPVNFDALSEIVERALKNHAAKRQLRKLQSQASALPSVCHNKLVGESRPITELRALIRQIADLDTSILISGESGTGKEHSAKVIHQESKRSKMPFVVVNCATMAECSMEMELFGDCGPSGQPQQPERCGLIGSAAGGTLFFDEILHLPLHLQPKLLRLLEERVFRPTGCREELPCTARFIISTSQDLDKVVKNGGIREDLFFRINVLHIKLTPLRARNSDVLILAHHFLRHFTYRFNKKVTSISARVIDKLVNYEWPGNIRELRNTIERAVAVAKYDQLVVEDLPENLQRFRISNIYREAEGAKLIPIDVVEQRHIFGVLKEVGGNKALAAKVLRMDRKTLYRKLEQYRYEE